MGSVLLLLPLVACRAAAPFDGYLVIVNDHPEPAEVRWEPSDPALGRGTEPIDACSIYRRAFGAGAYEVTVATPTDIRTFALSISRASGETMMVHISPDGTVAEPTQQDSSPQNAC